MRYLRCLAEGFAAGTGLGLGLALGWNLADRAGVPHRHGAGWLHRKHPDEPVVEREDDEADEAEAGECVHAPDLSVTPVTDVTCGAQDWSLTDRPGQVIVFGTCQLPAGHGIGDGGWWHRELRNGVLGHEWYGDPASRAPEAGSGRFVCTPVASAEELRASWERRVWPC